MSYALCVASYALVSLQSACGCHGTFCLRTPRSCGGVECCQCPCKLPALVALPLELLRRMPHAARRTPHAARRTLCGAPEEDVVVDGRTEF